MLISSGNRLEKQDLSRLKRYEFKVLNSTRKQIYSIYSIKRKYEFKILNLFLILEFCSALHILVNTVVDNVLTRV